MPTPPSTPSVPKPPSGTGLPAPAARERAVVRPSSAPAPVDARSKTKELFTTAPRLEVPKGGGAIKGIGEKFQANPVTGTASFSVPVALSPGRNGFTPALSLSYDSGSGNGPFGLGWSVGIPSIQRKTDRGLPRYRDAEDGDTFVLSDAEDLVPFQAWTGTVWAEPALAAVTEGGVTYARRRYRPRVEAGFARIERWTSAAGATHWRTWSRENVRRIFGMDATGSLVSDGDPASIAARAAGRLVDPDDSRRVFRWYLQEERDELGNLIRYEYATEDRAGAPVTVAERLRTYAGNGCTYVYLKRVLYGNVTPGDATGGWLFEVVLDYADHSGDATASPPTAPPQLPDATWSTRSDIQSNFRSGFDVRCYRLCTRILLFHRFDAPTSATTGTIVRSTELTHSASAVATTLTSVVVRGWRYDTGTSAWTTATMPPLDFGYGAATIDTAVKFVTGLDDLPNGLDTSRWQWADLDGEGLSGLLSEQGGQWFYKRNNGEGAMGAARVIRTRPSLAALNDPQCRLMDLDGDGRMEIVSLRPGISGSYARGADGEWQGFKPFNTLPTTSLNDPNVRLIDLDGDGRADILLTEDDVFTWYPSDGRNGWTKPEQRRKEHDEDRGPTLVFSSQSESIFLADLTGDGLTDLVRVRNGNVSYWPNRGYGRFGGRIQMGKAPWFDGPDRFDPKRVRFADVDGSGPADLLYLGPSSVRIWANESGNRWSTTPTTLPKFPGVEDSASIQVADLLGDGTSCLVWSSPLIRDAWRPLRYVHLMGDGKPYLLRSIDNHLGRRTTLTYAPSTRFYVADREAGTPWATRLPFPVQVLQKVEVADAVTGWSNATVYAYHHGYHDPDEREFRGFGKVEAWDTETVPLGGVSTDLPAVRTVTWFHTGAWRQEGTLEDAFATEYFAGDGAAFARTACALSVADDDPAPLRARERREASRALKGRPLRQEVYAEDGTSTADIPYTVVETCFTAARLQRADDDTHGVFLVTPLQTLTTHYERDADDPRIVQERTLEVDDYGTVTRAVTIVYPRRAVTSPDTHDLEQRTGVAIVTRTEVVHDDDVATNPDRWHIGVPYRTRSWQLVPGATTTLFNGLVSASTIEALLPPAAGGTASTPVLDFDESLSATDYLKKIADKVTTYDDAGSEAPAGTLGARALPYQAYQLAFTATQADAHDARLAALGLSSTVLDEGYAKLTTSLLTGSGDDAEGAWARSGTQTRDSAHFYVASAVTDAFGATTSITWHSSYLFPASVTDALGNVVSATYDLVALAPSSLTDPNRNVTQTRFDALGRVVAIARSSDTGDGETDLDDPSQAFGYDLTVIPATAYATVRDLHASETGTARWIETYLYSDGAGNVVMQKATAAPDAATPTTARWTGSGRVVLNNKGLPIKQYEPFFSASSAFEAEEGFTGVTPVITYDPPGRAVRVDLPNGTLRRVAFDPWKQTTWDENDSIDESTADAGLVATVPSSHKDTPTTVHLDAQGRPYKTEELTAYGGTPLVTTLTLDVVGNATDVADARANAATIPWSTQSRSFDLLGRPITTTSADGGAVTVLLDAGGAPRFEWHDGDVGLEIEVDALRRPVREWEWDTATPAKILRVRRVYGEALEDATATPPVDPADTDLRGRLVRVYDAACADAFTYDWKGNVTSTTRRFLADDEADVDWAGDDPVAYPYDPTVPDDAATVADLDASAELDSETFTVSTTFDALDRVLTDTAPDGSVKSYTYDDGARFSGVGVDSTPFASGTVYNARGQREAVDYGNGVSTVLTYDAETFRLDTLTSTRTADSVGMQALSFSYDAVGNLLGIGDAVQKTVYFNNSVVSADQAFEHDALYRLTNAWGREKSARGRADWVEPDYGDAPDASETCQLYEQRYTYDEVGNLGEMRHLLGGSTSWVRTYAYASASNQLATTTETAGTVAYQHDARGNIVFLPHLYNDGASPLPTPNVTVTYRDQMRRVQLNASDYAVYFYDRAGQRVRKVVKKGANVEDRKYILGYEVWRKSVSGTLDEERTTLHVMDGESRIAMVETKTVAGGSVVSSPVGRVRYQFGNHLGSAVLELDETGQIISYEEYHPYGSTSWWAGDSSIDVSRKRYRYTGMERDEETGLQCHGVRYYAPWLGRWTSADPIGLGDGVNRFCYCHASPVGGLDSGGMEEFSWSDRISTAFHAEVAAAVDTVSSAGDTLAAVGTAVAHPIDTASALYGASPLKKAVGGDFAGAAKQVAEIDASIVVGAGKTLLTVAGVSTGVLPAYNAYKIATGTKEEVQAAGKRNVDQGVTAIGVVASIVAPEAGAAVVARAAPALRAGVLAAKLATAAPELADAAVGAAEVAELAPSASRGLSVASTGGEVLPASMVGTVARGERIADLIAEGKSLTFSTGNEHALVRLAGGERAIVSGGPGGISAMEDLGVDLIYGHTHPYGLGFVGPSAADRAALEQLGQSSSYVLENGTLEKFWGN